MTGDPDMLSVAPTMVNDFEVMGNFNGGTIPEPLVRAISAPTLVIAGGTSPEFFRAIAVRIAEMLPNGKHSVLEGHDHARPPTYRTCGCGVPGESSPGAR